MPSQKSTAAGTIFGRKAMMKSPATKKRNSLVQKTTQDIVNQYGGWAAAATVPWWVLYNEGSHNYNQAANVNNYQEQLRKPMVRDIKARAPQKQHRSAVNVAFASGANPLRVRIRNGSAGPAAATRSGADRNR